MNSLFLFLSPILSPSPSSRPSKNQVSSKYPIALVPGREFWILAACEGTGSWAPAVPCFYSEHPRSLYGFGADPEGMLELTLEMK